MARAGWHTAIQPQVRNRRQMFLQQIVLDDVQHGLQLAEDQRPVLIDRHVLIGSDTAVQQQLPRVSYIIIDG